MDVDLTECSEAELRDLRQRFAMSSRARALFDSLTSERTSPFRLHEHGRYTRRGDRESGQRAARVVDLAGIELMRPADLSGGMKKPRRPGPRYGGRPSRDFLYDEPTTGLDPINREIICRLILSLSQGGRGFVVVSHAIADLLVLADRFLVVEGRQPNLRRRQGGPAAAEGQVQALLGTSLAGAAGGGLPAARGKVE